MGIIHVTLPETDSSCPETRPSQKQKSFSNEGFFYFQVANMWVSGRVSSRISRPIRNNHLPPPGFVSPSDPPWERSIQRRTLCERSTKLGVHNGQTTRNESIESQHDCEAVVLFFLGSNLYTRDLPSENNQGKNSIFVCKVLGSL